MARVLSSAVPLFLSVDFGTKTPLVRQVYEALRDGIVSGRLRSGLQVPSSRQLANELGVSRTTVVGAYDRLAAEGLIEAIRGAGSFVARDREVAPGRGGGESNGGRSGEHRRPLSRAAEAYRGAVRVRTMGPKSVPFRLGEPDVCAFPVKVWSRLQAKHWRMVRPGQLQYGDSVGALDLREQIATHLSAVRGIHARREQVILVRGTQQGVDLAGRVLLEPGDTVCVEDPGYPVTRAVLAGLGVRLKYVPVDSEGIDVGALRESRAASAIFVTPSVHYPLGVALSMRRRAALLEWARGAGAWVIEDDYDSEFRYSGERFTALQGLDADERVIYTGTFSKTMFPALRLAYLVVPHDLVGSFEAAKSTTDHASSTVDQAVLTEFLRAGHFARHVRRMVALYKRRLEVLEEAVSAELDDVMRLQPTGIGMHAIGWLLGDLDDAAVSAAALAHGIEAPALSHFCVERRLPPALVIGFAAIDERAIRPAVKRLARAIESVLAPVRAVGP